MFAVARVGKLQPVNRALNIKPSWEPIKSVFYARPQSKSAHL